MNTDRACVGSLLDMLEAHKLGLGHLVAKA
jgi:hypothetical protein